MTTRYLICGGRDFDDWAMLDRALSALILHPKTSTIIHGAARGADTLAGRWGKDHHAEVLACPADWKSEPRGAGIIRNRQMLEDHHPDVVIAFPGRNGTADMIRQARAAGVVTIQVVA